MKKVGLIALVGERRLEDLFEPFSELTGVPFCLTDVEGKKLYSNEWNKDLEKIRTVDISFRDIIENKRSFSKIKEMVSIKSDIIINDESLGTLKLSQFFFDEQKLDPDFFYKDAEDRGINQNFCKDVFSNIPFFTKEKIKTILKYVSDIINIITDLAYQNYKINMDVKELRSVQNELSLERHKFLDMLESSIDMLYRIDLDKMEVDYVSPSVFSILGYTVDEVYSMAIRKMKDVIHKNDFHIIDDYFKYSSSEKALYDIVTENRYRIKAKDGSFRAILDRSKITRGGSNNRKYLIGSMRDISSETQRENELGNKLEFEKILSKITSRLIHTPIDQIDEEINNSLRKIGKFTKASRCYLYSSESSRKIRKVFEWREKDVLPSANTLDIDRKQMPMLSNILVNGHKVNISDIDDIPEEYSKDREMLKRIGVRSLAVVPLKYGKSIIGILGMSAINQKIQWKEEIFNLLEVLGQVFVNALLRKETDREIKAKSLMLEKITGLVPSFIFVYDIQENNIVWGNKDILNDLGYSDEDRKNMDTSSLMSIIHPDDVDSILKENSKMLISDNAVDHREVRVIAKDGGIRYYYIRSVIFKSNDDGRIKQTLANAIDVTDQKIVEKELEERQKQYRSLIETMNEGFAVIDNEEKHIFVNQKFCDITGYSKDELINMPISLLLDEENLHYVRNTIKNRETGKETPYEIRLKRKDGNIVEVLSSPRNVMSEKGKVIGSYGVFTDLTEIKRIQRQLKQSKEKYKNIYEKTPVMLHSINKKAEILNVSDHWLEKLGYKREEVIGTFIYDYMTQQSADYSRKVAIPEFFRSGKLKYVPYQFIKKDGKVIDVLLSAIAEWDEKKDILRSLALLEDITERKVIEDKLLRSEEKYRILVETSKNPILIINSSRKITDSNKAACDFFGYSNDDILNLRFDDLIEEHLNLDNLLNNKEFIESGLFVETFAVTSNEESVPVEINAQKIFENNGSFQLVVYIHDISSYKLVEKKLNILLNTEKVLSYCIQTLLADKSDALDNVLEHILDTAELDQISIYENFIDPIDGNCMNLISNVSTGVKSFNIKKYNHIPYEEYYIRWQQLMLNKKIIINNVANLPHPERKILKEQKVGSVVAIPIHFGEKWYGFVSFAKNENNGSMIDQDINFLRTVTEMIGIYLDRKKADFERKKLIAKLKISNEKIENDAIQLSKLNKRIVASEEKLKRSNTSKDKFFSIIAHDLRTPLTGFHGMTKLLYEEKEKMSKEELDEFTEMLYTSSQQITKLLENLLQWSRIQRGVLEYNEEQFQLYLVVNFISELFHPNMNAKRIKFKNNIDEKIWVKADNNAVNTIIRNLLSNAIKFTNFGGKITIEAKQQDDFIAVSVSDSGVGMEKDDIDKIFKIDKHHSTTGTNNETGTGLGLILCKDLTNMCGGEISVDSTPGVGTTFTFTLKKSDISDD